MWYHKAVGLRRIAGRYSNEQGEKLILKFYKKPIPNDLTFDEIEILAKYYAALWKREESIR
jgi:hypothetical protein